VNDEGREEKAQQTPLPRLTRRWARTHCPMHLMAPLPREPMPRRHPSLHIILRSCLVLYCGLGRLGAVGPCMSVSGCRFRPRENAAVVGKNPCLSRPLASSLRKAHNAPSTPPPSLAQPIVPPFSTNPWGTWGSLGQVRRRPPLFHSSFFSASLALPAVSMLVPAPSSKSAWGPSPHPPSADGGLCLCLMLVCVRV
jgi:hypothetical protein